MDIKEKRKQYYNSNYIDNRDRILERNKQYYYDNREERLKYTYEYRSVKGHKYIGERKKERYNKRYNRKLKTLDNIVVTFN
jgi:hypothetical protein